MQYNNIIIITYITHKSNKAAIIKTPKQVGSGVCNCNSINIAIDRAIAIPAYVITAIVIVIIGIISEYT